MYTKKEKHVEDSVDRICPLLKTLFIVNTIIIGSRGKIFKLKYASKTPLGYRSLGTAP